MEFWLRCPPESDANLYRALKLYEALKALVGMQQIRLQGLALAVPGQTQKSLSRFDGVAPRASRTDERFRPGCHHARHGSAAVGG